MFGVYSLLLFLLSFLVSALVLFVCLLVPYRCHQRYFLHVESNCGNRLEASVVRLICHRRSFPRFFPLEDDKDVIIPHNSGTWCWLVGGSLSFPGRPSSFLKPINNGRTVNKNLIDCLPFLTRVKMNRVPNIRMLTARKTYLCAPLAFIMYSTK